MRVVLRAAFPAAGAKTRTQTPAGRDGVTDASQVLTRRLITLRLPQETVGLTSLLIHLADAALDHAGGEAGALEAHVDGQTHDFQARRSAEQAKTSCAYTYPINNYTHMYL